LQKLLKSVLFHEEFKSKSSNRIEVKHIRKNKNNVIENIEDFPISDEIKEANEIEIIRHDLKPEFSFSYSVLDNQEILKRYLSLDNLIVKISYVNLLNWKNKYKMNNLYNIDNKTEHLPQLNIDYI